MERLKIATGYYQSGYGKGKNTRANVYLIDGKLYAKDTRQWNVDFNPLDGELTAYVRVNHQHGTYFQVYGTNNDHLEYKALTV